MGSSKHKLGDRLVLTLPIGEPLKCVIYLMYRATNNETEYEDLIIDHRLAKGFSIMSIIVKWDSHLVIN